MYKVVLLRHGESTWNKENKFTGWTDVDLSEKGLKEAGEAGEVFQKDGYAFDVAYTSVLKRAIRTLWIVMDKMDLMWIPVIRSWRLNERHYGALQGFNKAETAKEYGDEQVLIWRRSYDTPPPSLEKTDERWPGFDPRYKNLDPKDVPVTECLKDTVARRAGKNSVIADLNYFFLVEQMIIPGSIYWNGLIGKEPGDVLNDKDGIENLNNLAENISWLAKKLY